MLDFQLCPGYIEYIKKNKLTENYINPIVSVITGHIFNKSNVLRVVNLGEHVKNQKKIVGLDHELESKINLEGSKLLEKIIEENHIRSYINQVHINILTIIV